MAQSTLPALYQTYDLNVGVIVDIEDMIHLLDPFEAPLQGMNGADGRSALSTGTCFEKKVEWLDEELLLPKSMVLTTITAGTTGVAVQSGHGLRFSTGDVIISDNEKMKVQAISGDVLTIDRGAFGTTAATHTGGTTNGATILILGQALSEGSNPENPRAIDRTNRFNVTQIFGPTAVRVSGTENVVRKYGLSGMTEFDKQVANRSKEQIIQVDQTILYGTCTEVNGGDSRTMGGFTNYITTNVDSTTTTITEAVWLNQMQATWDLGGRVDRLIVGATQKRRLSAVATGAGTALAIQSTQSERTRGIVVDNLLCDFGQVSILLDRWCRSTDMFGIDRDQAELLTLRPMQFEMLAKTGDSIHGQILQERTLRFRRERHAFRYSALT
jgi:hypothetical protein